MQLEKGSATAKAYRYRNRERFKHDILFHLGGPDLYPGRWQIPGDYGGVRFLFATLSGRTKGLNKLSKNLTLAPLN